MGYFKDLWKNGFRTFENSRAGFEENHDGYIMIYEPNHPNSKKNGWIKEHRWIMSQHIDRALREWEHVHHKNGNKKDNRLENLELMTNSEHDRLTRNPNPVAEKICYLCGTEETYINKKGFECWKYDIDNKVLCEWCYARIHQRYVREHKKGIKPRVYNPHKKHIPIFESRILAEFTISNSSGNSTVTTEITG
jgi:hypothetical protein